jgi:hypothetical protein
LSIRFTPFSLFKKQILLDEIKSVEVISYDAVSEHGGWGWRVGGFGRAFTAYGQKAVKVTTNAGLTILIGTQRPYELAPLLKRSNSSFSTSTVDQNG